MGRDCRSHRPCSLRHNLWLRASMPNRSVSGSAWIRRSGRDRHRRGNFLDSWQAELALMRGDPPHHWHGQKGSPQARQ
jgi:hypothetical protein